MTIIAWLTLILVLLLPNTGLAAEEEITRQEVQVLENGGCFGHGFRVNRPVLVVLNFQVPAGKRVDAFLLTHEAAKKLQDVGCHAPQPGEYLTTSRGVYEGGFAEQLQPGIYAVFFINSYESTPLTIRFRLRALY